MEFDKRIVLIILVLYSTILNFKTLKIIRDDKRVSRTKFFITVTLFFKLLYLLFLKHYAASTYMQLAIISTEIFPSKKRNDRHHAVVSNCIILIVFHFFFFFFLHWLSSNNVIVNSGHAKGNGHGVTYPCSPAQDNSRNWRESTQRLIVRIIERKKLVSPLFLFVRSVSSYNVFRRVCGNEIWCKSPRGWLHTWLWINIAASMSIRWW